LSNSAITVLKSLGEKYGNMYLVTDGNLTVQRNKISSLQLDNYFFKCMPTHQYGIKHSKPSLHCFDLIKSWEGVDYSNLVYIGDNPHKDFIALKTVGAMTIRINTGMFTNVRVDEAHEARYQVDSLEELLKIL
jgi:putative hydrolase of the HAD superfamily